MVTLLACTIPTTESNKDDDSKGAPHFTTTVFTDPRNLLKAVGIDLETRAKESNIVYAHAYKLASQLRSNKSASIAPGQFWITCHSRQNDVTTLEFVLSCTEGPLGPYPVFIYAHRPNWQSSSSSCTSRAHLNTGISTLAKTLHGLVPPARVFSIFSLTPVTHAFATEWTTLIKGIYPVTTNPWYAATSSYCTVETIRRSTTTTTIAANDGGIPSEHVMRRATMDDLDQCAALCEVFAKTGPPYEINTLQARKEAEVMINANQLWVYQLPTDLASGTTKNNTAIATIVAVTRSTPTVSAITKVYTNAAHRNRGCAEKLVAHVSNELLSTPIQTRGGCPKVDAYVQATKKAHSVVLFVGHTLDATRVYRRVGFVGLDGSKGDGIEDWLELGFEGANLGHW